MWLRPPLGLAFGEVSWVSVIVPPPFVPVLAGILVPERRTAQENARLEIGSQRGRNSHRMGVLGIYDLQGLIYGRTELLVTDMRLLASARSQWRPPWWEVPLNGALPSRCSLHGLRLCDHKGHRPQASPLPPRRTRFLMRCLWTELVV